MRLPDVFTSNMRSLLDNEAEDFFKCYSIPPYTALRVNTLKIQPDKMRELIGLDPGSESVKWCPQGIYSDGSSRLSKSVFYNAGLYYLQEPSAMAPVAVTDIHPGDKVLDLCAAPGGKSTHAGARLKGSGLLVSNDISASRCGALVKNIEIFGIKNAVILNERPEKLAGRFEGFFNKILIDAPCSGEGMFRKDLGSVKSWDEHKWEKCRVMQQSIMHYAGKMLAPGGTITYSTCTFEPEENERLIKYFLEKNSDFDIIPINHKHFGFEPARPEWAEGMSELSGASRLWPHKIKGEGHFIALLKKNAQSITGEFASEETENGKNLRLPGKSELEYFHLFCREYLNIEINGCFAINGASLYLVPESASEINFSGIRIVRSGWYLGDIRTKRFEPSQALAMALKIDDVNQVINMKRDDENIYRYLRGESLDIPAKDGWNLICAEGYPLGWAKATGGRVKNKYLKGWRT